MIAELGHFAVILALCLALAQGVFGLLGAHLGSRRWMAAVRPAASGQFVFVALSFACLTASFLRDDFSVLYVAMNSNTELPTMYKVAAVWGAHEGSLLLWALVLSVWTVAVCALSTSLPPRFASRVIGVLGLLSVGFLLFTLGTSNPFERLIPMPLDGRDLNPLLQDFGLAIHPPMLYLGYVGFSVAFAFAIAAMLEGHLDAKWARWTRPWTTVAWAFLTVGIALGSWWAYYELGWGGWWFWDPVENASFMPWLVGTALIHSLAVTEKRELFKSWTLLLAVSAFSLSLLGTFLVRSGVLVSVHAFATDPERGFFILMFLVVTIGSALALYAWRAPSMGNDKGFKAFSRETFLLANNVLLVIAAMLILLGTLYPLFLDALGMGKISVGVPYFAVAFLIPMIPLIMLVAIGMHVAWKRAKQAEVAVRVRGAAVLALVIAVALPLSYGRLSLLSVVAVFCGGWVMLSSLIEPWRRFRLRGRLSGIPASVLGMSIAHFGLGVFILGVTIVSAYSLEEDVAMKRGDSIELAGYHFEFDGVEPRSGANYEAIGATVIVRDANGDEHTRLYPEKRVYRVQKNPMTESDIAPSLARDLYVALGDDLGKEAWSLRVHYKPLVRFIWLGALIMAIGGVVAVSDRRYRRASRTSAARAEDTALARGQS